MPKTPKIRAGLATVVAIGCALLGGTAAQAGFSPAVPQPLQSSIASPAAVRSAVAPAQAPLSAAAQFVSFDKRMIALINQARTQNGRAPLQEGRGLTSLSVWWSSRLDGGATNYQLAHNPNAWTMLTSSGASKRTSWGENVAWSSSTLSSADDVFAAYMNSPGHKANILSQLYHFVGMGTVTGANGLWNTTEFTDTVDAGQALPTVGYAPPASPVSATVRDAVSGSVLKPTLMMLRDSTCARPLRLLYADTSGVVPVPIDRTGIYCLQVRTVPAGYQVPAMRRFGVHVGTTVAVRLTAPLKSVSGQLVARSASSGAGMPGAVFMLRDQTCTKPLRLLHSGAGGVTPVTSVSPGTYCVTTAVVPGGFDRHAPFTFVAPANGTFTIPVSIAHSV